VTVSIRRILIAVDDQPLAPGAAEFGRQLSPALDGEIGLINVNDASVEFGRAEQDSKRLTDVRERLSLPASTVQFVQAGQPAEAIAKTAKEWSADLIVIASHGHTGVARAVLGSVAESVMRNAPCPVLVVRPQE
jgi:universal stress protein A